MATRWTCCATYKPDASSAPLTWSSSRFSLWLISSACLSLFWVWFYYLYRHDPNKKNHQHKNSCSTIYATVSQPPAVWSLSEVWLTVQSVAWWWFLAWGFGLKLTVTLIRRREAGNWHFRAVMKFFWNVLRHYMVPFMCGFEPIRPHELVRPQLVKGNS